MSQQLEAYTEQLLDIIQILQMQRASGILQVRRGEGITAEEGRITFANGRATDAHAGRRVGSEAVSWISSWPMCWVRFLSHDPTFSLEKVLRMISQPPVSNSPQQQNTPPAGYNPIYTPIPEPRSISPLRKLRNTTESSMQSGDASSSVRPSGPHPPGDVELFVPMMVVKLDVALRMLEAGGLTRVHRQLLLLTDGRRHIGELMRLTRRDKDDVYGLLRDLEKIHIIQLTSDS